MIVCLKSLHDFVTVAATILKASVLSFSFLQDMMDALTAQNSELRNMLVKSQENKDVYDNSATDERDHIVSIGAFTFYILISWDQIGFLYFISLDYAKTLFREC